MPFEAGYVSTIVCFISLQSTIVLWYSTYPYMVHVHIKHLPQLRLYKTRCECYLFILIESPFTVSMYDYYWSYMTELLGFGNPLYVIDDQYLLLAAGRKVSSSNLQRDTTPET